MHGIALFQLNMEHCSRNGLNHCLKLKKAQKHFNHLINDDDFESELIEFAKLNN